MRPFSQWVPTLSIAPGGKIHFHQQLGGGNFSYTLIDITDLYGAVITVTLDVDFAITKITEPAGRWLKLTYDSLNGKITRGDAGYGAPTITQSVTDTYGTWMLH